MSYNYTLIIYVQEDSLVDDDMIKSVVAFENVKYTQRIHIMRIRISDSLKTLLHARY